MSARKPRRLGARKRGVLQHYFIPGSHNAYRPLFLQIEAFVVQIAIIILLFLIAFGVERLVVKSPSPQIGAVVAAVLIELANADRIDNDAPQLAVDPRLEEAAQMKADDMASRGYFSHQTPEGLQPWDWMQRAGYQFSAAGENLAVYFSDSAEVQRAWMASPTHRANILNDRYTEIGIAIAHGTFEGTDATFVVQMFGSPAEASADAVVGSTPEVAAGETVAGAAAEAQPIGAVKGSVSGGMWRLLTAPKTALQWAYIGLGLLILLAVSLLFLFELRRLHVPTLVRGMALLALITTLLWSGTVHVWGELLIL